jgi:hypothetical protein
MARMIPWYEKLLAAIVVGLMLPLLVYGFRVTPWSNPITYWNVVLVCFAISFLVYKLRKAGEARSRLRIHLTNFVISFVVLFVVAGVYFAILIALQKLISTAP